MLDYIEALRLRSLHTTMRKMEGTVNSFAQIFSCSIDIAAQVSLSASARHRNGNNSAGTTFAY